MMTIEQQLLDDYQHSFPLTPEPYSDIAHELKTDTKTVLGLLSELNASGKVSRVGPVFKPNTLGVSTLAAMRVPAHQLTEVASWVSDFHEVNHNYEREHQLNLWFVVVAADQPALNQVLDAIEQRCGYAVMNLPLLKEYHIDLGFKMSKSSTAKSSRSNVQKHAIRSDSDIFIDQRLVSAIQAGLPLVERPYRAIGDALGESEKTVIDKISELQSAGIIRRLGVVVKHHELGYRANAMLVWDIPDEQIDELGKQLSADESVTLCYQRPRQKDWPYNLFSMIHGKSRDYVMGRVDHLVQQHGLEQVSYEILFSRQRFKQCGAKYFVKGQMAS